MADAKPNIKPLGSKVLVKRLEAETKTAGGIVLPDSAQEKPRQGTVLSVGTGKTLADGSKAAMQVSEGDTVLFASYGADEIKIDGVEYLLMDESSILAILG